MSTTWWERPRVGLALGVALLILAPLLSAPEPVGAAAGGTSGEAIAPEASASSDALRARVTAELGVFTTWLEANGTRGYVGEVGWPNDAAGEASRWNALAEAWLSRADAAGLWVTYWDAGESRNTYPLAAYKPLGFLQPVARADTQAAVIEAHLSADRYRRGAYLMTAARLSPYQDEATSSFSNTNAGVYGRDYKYDDERSLRFLASRGLDMVTIGFRWERLQPALGGPFDQLELGRLRAAVVAARRAGLQVVIQPFNKGAYYLFDGTQGVKRPIGSAECTQGHFGDLWRRLSQEFRDDPTVVAYGLMNEPAGSLPAAVWESSSQSALDAIRANGDGKLIMVPGASWSVLRRWPTTHPRAWINDPVDNFRYEAHQYFDWDASGTYARSYAAEVAIAESRGFGRVAGGP